MEKQSNDGDGNKRQALMAAVLRHESTVGTEIIGACAAVDAVLTHLIRAVDGMPRPDWHDGADPSAAMQGLANGFDSCRSAVMALLTDYQNPPTKENTA